MTVLDDGSDLSDFQPIKRRKSNVIKESEDDYQSSSLSDVSESELQEETIVEEPTVVVEPPKPKQKKSDDQKEKKPKVRLFMFN